MWVMASSPFAVCFAVSAITLVFYAGKNDLHISGLQKNPKNSGKSPLDLFCILRQMLKAANHSTVWWHLLLKYMWRCSAKCVKFFKILTTFSSLFIKFPIKSKKKKIKLRNFEAMLHIEGKHFLCSYCRKYSHGSMKAARSTDSVKHT